MTAVLEAQTISMPGVYRRFLAKVDSSGGPQACHPWTGARTTKGYGQLRVDARVAYAHRLALESKLGRPLHDGELARALHSCDNPPCVNPVHLYAGDQTRNMRDCADRGRVHLAGLALGRLSGNGKYRTGPELCGTVRGYNRHLRHGEVTCAGCRAAVAEYNRCRQKARS